MPWKNLLRKVYILLLYLETYSDISLKEINNLF